VGFMPAWAARMGFGSSSDGNQSRESVMGVT
jgi:hypothetical protein